MNTPLPPTPTDFIDLGQANREGPFSRRFLWKLIGAGQLPAYKPFKNKVLIKRSDIAKLIEASRLRADRNTPVDETLTESGPRNG